ncbi:MULTISPECIES: hypothetical protein [unclassified Micromonospora]|uniref:hypothetical protein n=1 Tax=unclassified Micromonospora TaxID=2617518 RepID=UPI00188E98DB|nr:MULTISPECIES: hypothetical protein [unclassified Micromonospora]MBF5032140.1 hypothetical protein [Micromonospora sp. ANENR4]MCZ7477949.1 hypothetical protein [Micromonospora sp. WMMC273]WBC02656.1 hypothetical protein O7546_26650 [Micromonospora sp. WMMA1976]
MQLMLAWAATSALPRSRGDAAVARFHSAAAELVPESWHRRHLGGTDSGVLVLHPSDPGGYRWPPVAGDDDVTAVSVGIPVGVDGDDPVTLARHLLTGADVHRDVVPPFALLALGHDRLALQQDWLGMARVFTGTADGVTAWCTRPGLLAAFLHGEARPDPAGWSSYLLTGHFGGDLSPLADIRLLRPGERITGRRRADGGWQLTSEIRYATDDVVRSGLTDRDRPLGERLDRAADALTRAVAGLHRLHDGEVTLGLSGGKDSRLIAATLVAAGRTPNLATNDDTAAEGDVARELVRLVRDRRGLELPHRLVPAAPPAAVLGVGLRERARRLAALHDHQFPSNYLARPAVRTRLPEVVRAPSLTGAAGELVVGYWYPRADADPAPTPEQAGLTKLLAGVPNAAVSPEALATERDRVTALLAHARDIGLRDEHLIDYLYLVERMRRWCTSAYTTGMVTPFLAPGFVAASFAFTAAEKRARLPHTALIARLVPEWADVPFVSAATGPSRATRIWEGDGVAAVSDLLDTVHGPLTELIRRPVVERDLRTAARGGRPDPRVLAQFTALAVASERLEPGFTRPSTGATYARVTAPPRPRTPAKSRLAGLRWVRRSRLGDRLWVIVRRQVRGR